MESKYTAKLVNGIFVLHVNERPCECPFRSSAPAQDNFHRIQFISQPCSSTCPHFSIYELESEPSMVDDTNVNTVEVETVVTITCGSGRDITVEITEDKGNIKSLIN